MGVFRWVSDEPIPPALDLRVLGWTRVGEDDARECVAIVLAESLDCHGVLKVPGSHGVIRSLTIVAGVNQTDERANFLAQGFGEAVGERVTLKELDARARRLPVAHNWLPRRRAIGRLELDLLTRDGSISGQAIGLKPREFELLWRLADTPDQAVSRQSLVHDVLGLNFEPVSNSIAVHMSRLRGKLVAAGLKDLVETQTGGYRLRVPPAPWTSRVPPVGGADPRFG